MKRKTSEVLENKQKKLKKTSSTASFKRKCKFCRQHLEKVSSLCDYLEDAVEEPIAITNEKLQIDSDEFHSNAPEYKLTAFSFYDKEKHVCAFDTGLIENEVEVWMCGYLKRIDDENASIEGGIASIDIGPLTAWWVTGFDGGSAGLCGVSTAYADYFLMEPHDSYAAFMEPVREKICMTKFMIEHLQDNKFTTYEDLLMTLEEKDFPFIKKKLGEEELLQHAEFLCEQLSSFDEVGDDDDDMLMETLAMQRLQSLVGAPVKKRGTAVGQKRVKVPPREKKSSQATKATTTLLVQSLFEEVFPDQLDKTEKTKFNECSENKENENLQPNIINNVEKLQQRKDGAVNDGNIEDVDRCLIVNNMVITCGLSVIVNNFPKRTFVKVAYVDKKKEKPVIHAQLYTKSCDTVLGETSDPKELFLIDECETFPADLITDVITVHSSRKEAASKSYYYCQKKYIEENCRFVDVADFAAGICRVCEIKQVEKMRYKPQLYNKISTDDGKTHYGCVAWNNEKFVVGSCVMLSPEAYKLKKKTGSPTVTKSKEKVDEKTFPEKYRKVEHSKRICPEFPAPFHIARIVAIYRTNLGARLRVAKFYRPHNTRMSADEAKQADLNLLYWTNEECVVDFDDVASKCWVYYEGNLLESVDEWMLKGPARFYFRQAYDSKTDQFSDVPSVATLFGKTLSENEKYAKESAPSYPHLERKLRSMDIFSGCGGLSSGFHKAGLSKTLWAIEKETAAAEAFKLNNPDAIVFTQDCNILLRDALNGIFKDEEGQSLPRPGDVELLCGGPPCQGFSGMNRFNKGEYSAFKNSLLASFLSYCDFYRPRFLVMENVRNFVSFKSGLILKLTLRCLLQMGYQCTFGIVQAGCYGVPQTRRRVIIYGAAAGETLPLYPEPTHVFPEHNVKNGVTVDGKEFQSNIRFVSSAPYREITVEDAISDLPSISNGAANEKISYASKPKLHWQRMIRNNNSCIINNHICKQMSKLVEARIKHIPKRPGSDWRDLPNVQLTLPDGTLIMPLEYLYDDKSNGKSRDGSLRGVCPCASGKPCDPLARQSNTLIPWCLPHTGNRHNNWSCLYGRLLWNGIFSTTVTNPEPMGKQGLVLHPEDNRVVSVRECARSQGFDDTFIFYGNILDKHRQVGNAVPPPLACALGREIIKAIATKKDGLQSDSFKNLCEVESTDMSFVPSPAKESKKRKLCCYSCVCARKTMLS